jgi:predicted ATP-dependent protease
VETALDKRRNRANLPEQWIQDEIREGTLMVDLEGEVIGQVNGLSVHQMGDYSFGRPCRITAQTFVGNKGVIDIQREAELAGHIHSKGVMILAGYLAGQFAGSHPFALSATLTFEQGEIQPIGGANEKIEGFFESCRKRGLTGNQGVIIPTRNIKHLALRRPIVEAVEAGKFCVLGVNRIEEALELLTGKLAGERDTNGQFPDDTIFGLAAKRLEEMANIVATWGEQAPKAAIEEE